MSINNTTGENASHPKPHEVKELRKLCRAFLNAALERLEVEGTWPQPPAARMLRPGKDYHLEILTALPEYQELASFFINHPLLSTLYAREGSRSQALAYYSPIEKLLKETVQDSRGERVDPQVFNYWFKRFIREIFCEIARWRSIRTVTGVVVSGRAFSFERDTALLDQPGYNLGKLDGGQHIDFQTSAMGFDRATIVTDHRVNKRSYSGSSFPHFRDDYGTVSALTIKCSEVSCI